MNRSLVLRLTAALVCVSGFAGAADEPEPTPPPPEPPPAEPAPEPAVAPAPPPPEPEPPAQPERRVRYEQPNIGYYLAGLGGMSVAAGSIFGIAAIRTRTTSDEHCPDDRCTQRGVTLNEHAQTYAWTANIAIGAGLVLLAGGIYFLLRKPAADTSLDKAVSAATTWNSF